MSDFKLDQIQTGSSGMDAFFEQEPQMIQPFGQKAAATTRPPRIKVGSLAQLNGFNRISAETLIHKSTQDLWTITNEGGDLYIQRLFSDNGGPLKG
jgi:hypothetical protein